MEVFEDLACPDCNGRASPTPCSRCGGRNVYVVTGCPSRQVDVVARDALRLASFANRGILPRSGGLDVQRHRDVRLIQLGWAEMKSALAAKNE